MNTSSKLPPGQKEIDTFPRFGLNQFAERYRPKFDPLELIIRGDVQNSITIGMEELQDLPRVEQQSDFHCVTTWTKTGLTWSGFRFKDFYEQIVQAQTQPMDGITCAIFKSQDGYQSCLPLEDLLADEVLLADRLNGEPLSARHGEPLRLIAPAHYGYKNPKHVRVISFWRDENKFRGPTLGFMIHPRARVALEERGKIFPGWFLRYLYRPLVKSTIRMFERAEEKIVKKLNASTP